MADNIIIKITTEADLDAAQKQLQALTDKVKQQEAAIHDLTDQEKADAASIKEMVTERSKLNKALSENQRYYRGEKQAKKDEIAATKASIKELEKQVKAYKTLQGQSGRMVQQLRAMREELQRMEDSGQFGTKAFMDLAVAAGKLEDQIGDTQARIRVLSSDTIGLDTAMGVADGLAGAFYVATSAAEVFGTDMEALQEAFYRVQAAMSTLSGIQQMANTLNKDSVVSVVAQTAAAKLKEKAELRAAAATAVSTAATGTQTIATKLATKAQIGLNTAIAANPLAWLIGIIAVAVAAVAALGVGVYKLVQSFSAAGQAQKQFADASKELEKIQYENSKGAAKREYDKQQQLQATSNAEQKALQEATERNASEIEMAQIKQKYAKETAAITTKTTNEEIARNDAEIAKLDEMRKAKQAEVDARREGSKKQKKAQEELNEVEQQYVEALQKTDDLMQQQTDAMNAEAEAAYALQQAKEDAMREANRINIQLMQEGSAKEIALINMEYEERLKTIQGDSKEENELRVALLEQQEKEIAAVHKKYALMAQQTKIQEQRNLLEQLSQLGGTEEDYEKQLELTKKIAKLEAQARIDALDEAVLGEEQYKAEVEAIRLELNNTLKNIDEQEVQRLNELSKRKKEIAVAEAEAATRTLNGSESAEYQKKVWENYYTERANQIDENEKHEIEAINRSTATTEEKEAQITLIQKNAQKDREDLKKEEATKFSEIDAQYLDELQRNVEKADRDVEASQGSGKLQALKDRFNAEQELYQAQQDQLQAQYDAGLISYQEYKNQEWEILKASEDSKANYQMEKMQEIAEEAQIALDAIQQFSDLMFGAIQDNIQAEMDALDEMYTTDAEEAKENANKKYMSEKELSDKKKALELKQAKWAKAQALINAGIQTALAIITSLAQSPVAIGPAPNPAGIASLALATAMGAAQIAAIAAKPLAQYAKGRKGGKGEYALVGERGPEVMYVPEGASIVPNHYLGDMDAWSKFGVPALPNDMMSAAMLQQINIDYDRLGKAVAANIPQQKAVSVNVDRRGVTISDNGNRRTYLNHKYTGAWS